MTAQMTAVLWIAKADQALRAAHFNLEKGFPETAQNRAYYAMFYAAMAALATRGLHPKSHAGTRTMFAAEFMKTKQFNKDAMRFYMNAMDERLIADYEGAEINPSRVEEHVANAAVFIIEIKRFLELTPP